MKGPHDINFHATTRTSRTTMCTSQGIIAHGTMDASNLVTPVIVFPIHGILVMVSMTTTTATTLPSIDISQGFFIQGPLLLTIGWQGRWGCRPRGIVVIAVILMIGRRIITGDTGRILTGPVRAGTIGFGIFRGIVLLGLHGNERTLSKASRRCRVGMRKGAIIMGLPGLHALGGGLSTTGRLFALFLGRRTFVLL